MLVRFGALLLRVPRYLKLAYSLTRDRRLGRGQRALAAAAAVYTISPIDPIPGFIPVIGQLDDLAVLLLGLRGVLRSAPASLADEHLRRAGVSYLAIDDDLAAVRATAIWVAVTGGRAVGKVAGFALQAGQRQAWRAVRHLAARLWKRSDSSSEDESGNQEQAPLDRLR